MTTTDTVKLLPCPFCGGPAEVYGGKFPPLGVLYGVTCRGECGTFLDCRKYTQFEAIAAWNRRTALPAGETVKLAVKPLEWHGPDFEGEYWAASIAEKYVIRPPNGNGYWLGGVGGYFASVDAAKAAAQADYEARILSAIAIPGGEVEPVAKDNRCDYCKEHGFQHPNLCEDCRPAPSGEAVPVAWKGANYAAETKRLIEKALTDAQKVIGGPEGETILGYTLPSGLWLMLQANVRNLLETLPPALATPTPNPAPSGEGERRPDIWRAAHDVAALEYNRIMSGICKQPGFASTLALFAIRFAAAAPPSPQGVDWQPIDENTQTPALVCRFADEDHSWLPMTAYRVAGRWVRPASRDGLPYEPTHWMPLPKPLAAALSPTGRDAE